MNVIIRKAQESEFKEIGELMVLVYSSLEGFPKPSEQPAYYQLLANVGDLVKKPDVELLIASNEAGNLLGAVVWFGDMKHYGSGGTATQEKNVAGFRLLAVAPEARGLGVGKRLTMACIEKAKERHLREVIIHTTAFMQTAWQMYEAIGFRRSPELDFMQGPMSVYGFRYAI